MAYVFGYARPSADDLAEVDWQRIPAGGSIASAIDETSVDTGDVASVNSSPFTGDPDIKYRCTLAGLTGAPRATSDNSLRVWMQAVAGTHAARIRVLEGAGLELIATADKTVTPGHALHELVLTAGEVGLIGNYADLRAEVILLHDGSSWNLEVAMLEFRAPVGFAHLDISGAALVNAAAEGGFYLEVSGAGLIRRAGLEGTGSLVLPSGAGLGTKL